MVRIELFSINTTELSRQCRICTVTLRDLGGDVNIGVVNSPLMITLDVDGTVKILSITRHERHLNSISGAQHDVGEQA